MPNELPILDDNPASLDFLGFDAIVTTVAEAVLGSGTAPLTIGLRGGWGTGKSSLLGMLQTKLESVQSGGIIVIRVDPWEFESADMLRSSLIELVLSELEAHIPTTSQISGKFRRLIGRIRFGKVASALLKGVATVPLDAGWGMLRQLVVGMTEDVDGFIAPPAETTLPASMYGFREEFGRLIQDVSQETHIERVVVLVDDLDRCLPNVVVESLEAIKLFLSVERIVFILAADEGIVRSAIASRLDTTAGQAAFADLYMEKIVQLPFTIPALSPDDAVTYASLLLCALEDRETLATHCNRRRSAAESPLLDGVARTPTIDDAIALASQVCYGLDADSTINPRRIKRFLNSFSVRRAIASKRGIHLSASATAKLMLLEERYLDPDFRILAATPGPEIRDFLRRWEAWAQRNAEKPEGVSEGSREWAASPPSLTHAEGDIAAYVALAAALTRSMSGGPLSGKVAKFVEDLVSKRESEMLRRRVYRDMVRDLTQLEIEQVVEAVALRAPAMDRPAFFIRLVLEIVHAKPEVGPAARRVVFERLAQFVDVSVAGLMALSESREIVALARDLMSDARVQQPARAALRSALEV